MTTANDLEFRNNTLLKNAICTIKTNLKIDLDRLNNVCGGQLSTSLPGVRLVKLIDGQRYVFIIYKSGTIVLTNIFYINNLKPLIMFLQHFFFFLIAKSVIILPAAVKEIGDDEQEMAIDDTSEFMDVHFSLLIENFQFSFQINQLNFEEFYTKNLNLVSSDGTSSVECVYVDKQTTTESLRNILNSADTNFYLHMFETMTMYKFDFSKIYITFNNNFPADLLKIYVTRDEDLHNLTYVKSDAAKRRRQNNFHDQIISIHFFKNGKIILTGAQTKNDLVNFEFIFELILNFFFK